MVSVVHYTDNYFNYDDFPKPTSGPAPSQAVIGLAWFLFTGAGMAGYFLFRREPSTLSLLLLAFYSGSGLVGIGHYTVPGAFDMPAWRQAHVMADICLGAGMLAFTLWAAQRRNPRPA